MARAVARPAPPPLPPPEMLHRDHFDRVLRVAQLALLTAIGALLAAIYAKLPTRPPTFGEWRDAADRAAVAERFPLVRVERVQDPVTVDEVTAPVNVNGPVEVEGTVDVDR